MNKLTFLLILCGISFAQNPCDDSTYKYLKTKKLDSMSQREYDYFMQNNKYCNEQFSGKRNDTQKEEKIEQKIETTRIVVDYVMEKNYVGYKPQIGVYVDDVFYGKPLAIVNVKPGVHTVALFEEKAYSEANQNDKKRMNGGMIKIDGEANKVTKILFKYKCDIGMNFICNENEWYFKSEVTKLQ